MTDAEHQWQIAVCETSGWAKKPIEFATGGRKTHAYLVLDTCTYSMEPGGLIQRPFDYWRGRPVYSRFATGTALKQQMILSFLRQHAKARYDFPGDILVGIDDLTSPKLDGLFHLIEKAEDTLSWAWFCSAFADAAFTYAGFKILDDGRPFHAVTPMDLMREFVRRGWASPDD